MYHWIWHSLCVRCVFLCVYEDFPVCARFFSLSHPFLLVPCLKYFLANSNMSYLLSCRALSSRSPSAKPSRETFWKSKIDSEKLTHWQFGRPKNPPYCTVYEHVCVSVYLNRLIYLMCSHGGCHGDSDGWWNGELSRSSSRFCLAVQWQRQEVRRSNRVDALGRESTGATEHRTKLPTWHTQSRGITTIIQKHTHLGALCPETTPPLL